MKPSLLAVLPMIVLLALAGCASSYLNSPASSVLAGSAPLAEGDIGDRTYRAIDRMLDASPTLATTGESVVVGTIADIRDVNSATPLGNLIADLARSHLVQRGAFVTELRLRSSVKLDRTQGELMLSRDRRSLYPPPVASHMLAGTYAVANSKVYVSLKLISTADARIEAAADFYVPRQGEADALLLHAPAVALYPFDPARYR